VTVAGAITGQHTYNSVVVQAVADTTPRRGDILVRTQSGNALPLGFKAPVWVNWVQPSIADAVSVTLTIQGSGASFYSYNATNNTTIQTTSSVTCNLAYPPTTTNGSGCGFGLVGAASTGQVTLNATATSTSGYSFTIAPLVIGLVPAEPARRTVTFTNGSAATTIYVGITGGAGNAYLVPVTPTVPPGTPSANVKPGAGSTCGLTNPAAACPIGTTCLQGGANPSSDYVVASPFYCFYDQPIPSNGYALAPGTGTTTISLSGSSISPAGVIWSATSTGAPAAFRAAGAAPTRAAWARWPASPARPARARHPA
jgi:hypothetical protein